MIDQDTHKLRHAHDPHTSHEAAAANPTRKATHRALVLRAFADWPHSGLTGDEVAAETGLEVHEARRRVSDLRDLGLVEFWEVDGKRQTRASAAGVQSTVSRITQTGLAEVIS